MEEKTVNVTTNEDGAPAGDPTPKPAATVMPQMKRAKRPKRKRPTRKRPKVRVLKPRIRSVRQIVRARDEMFDKVWYDRHMCGLDRIAAGRAVWHPKILKRALAEAEKLRRKYGKKNLGPWTKFEWGMINGKLSALRWVLGCEWDMLAT